MMTDLYSFLDALGAATLDSEGNATRSVKLVLRRIEGRSKRVWLTPGDTIEVSHRGVVIHAEVPRIIGWKQIAWLENDAGMKSYADEWQESERDHVS